ncbi:hypothetical protein T484DRAFT_1754276 [Baffinella frigidus]|nr:hypothetical protein T484DRAFT_1754276 [Cryptophyta sp. CCMP2293]
MAHMRLLIRKSSSNTMPCSPTITMPTDAPAAAHLAPMQDDAGDDLSRGRHWFGAIDAPPADSSARSDGSEMEEVEESESEKAALRTWLATMVGDDAGLSAGVNYAPDDTMSELTNCAPDHALLVGSPQQDGSGSSSPTNTDLFEKLVLRAPSVEKRKCLECLNDRASRAARLFPSVSPHVLLM